MAHTGNKLGEPPAFCCRVIWLKTQCYSKHLHNFSLSHSSPCVAGTACISWRVSRNETKYDNTQHSKAWASSIIFPYGLIPIPLPLSPDPQLRKSTSNSSPIRHPASPHPHPFCLPPYYLLTLLYVSICVHWMDIHVSLSRYVKCLRNSIYC